MPIDPLDLQVNIAQMANVAQQQQTAQEQPIVQQEYMGMQAEKQSKIDQEKVQTIEKAEGKKIEADKKGGSGEYSYGGRRKQKEPQEEEGSEEEENLDPDRGHSIDITK